MSPIIQLAISIVQILITEKCETERHTSPFVRACLHNRTQRRAANFYEQDYIRNQAPSRTDVNIWCWLVAEQFEGILVRQEIEERAYLLWEKAGAPENNDWQHWFAAEKQIFGELKGRSEQMDELEPENVSATTAEVSDCAPVGPEVNSPPMEEIPPPSHSNEVGDSNVSVGKDADMDEVTEVPNSDFTFVRVEDKNGVCRPTSAVDFLRDEFVDKLVITDRQQTEVLGVADSLREANAIVSQLSQISGNAEFTIRHGKPGRTM